MLRPGQKEQSGKAEHKPQVKHVQFISNTRIASQGLPPGLKFRTLPPSGFHSSIHSPGFLPHSQHRQGVTHPHSLTQPGLKFNFVLRIFIFPEQKPEVLQPSKRLLCILLSGRQLHSGMQNAQSLT